MTVRQLETRSSIPGSLMMIPRAAAIEIAPIIATGIANNKGQGVAMTKTARNRLGSWPPTAPVMATLIANAVYHAPRRSAILRRRRSEEHTSELQSHSDLVCRLLLEKKKP